MTINQFLNITLLLKIKKNIVSSIFTTFIILLLYIVSTLLTFAILIRVSLFDDP